MTPMRPISSSHRCLLKKKNNFLSLNESSSDVTWGSSCYYHSSSMKAKALKKKYLSRSPRWNKATNEIIVLTQNWPFFAQKVKRNWDNMQSFHCVYFDRFSFFSFTNLPTYLFFVLTNVFTTKGFHVFVFLLKSSPK